MNDLKSATRALLRTPGFTIVAVVTLALGIGLNTAMFSFLNTLVLRPLSFPDSEQLVKIFRATPQGSHGAFSPADYLDLKRDETSFGRFAAYQHTTMLLSEPGRPDEWMRVSTDFFDVLAVKPKLGRFFRLDDEMNGSGRIVVISHAFWQDRLGGTPDVVGRTIRGDNETFDIVGVLPASANDHRLFGNIGVFRPLLLTPSERNDRGKAWLSILGRRAENLSRAQGEAFVASLGARAAADHPAENEGATWRTEELPRSNMSPTGYAMVFMLLGLSGFVLLIACSNLANFLLARAMERGREFAVRGAIGASRFQLIRPLAVEAIILGAIGGLSALLVSAWTTQWLRSVITSGGGPLFEFPLDWRVLIFAFAISALTLVFFGVAPALFTSRINANDALKSSARGATGGRRHQRLRQLLIVGQFGLAMVLLAGAGFFVRGAKNMLKQDYGWNSENVIKGEIILASEKYPNARDITGFHQRLLEQLQHLPGVQSASLSMDLPFRGLRSSTTYLIEGRETTATNRGPTVSLNQISPDYFNVTQTRLLRGRAFLPSDTASAPKVTIINETFARSFYPDENPIGRRVARGGAETADWAEIVGVVADARSIDVAQKPTRYQIYEPLAQQPQHWAIFSVRTAGITPAAAISSIRIALKSLDPDLAVRDLKTAREMISGVTSQLYLCTNLLSAFALLGLFLAGLGIYGVIARTVAQRVGEIGIRMALGAQVRDVISMILGSGVRLAITGSVLGLAGSLGLAKFFNSVFPTMQTDGTMVLAGGSVLLMLIALVACYLPARRASSIDPMVALRTE
jgi:putative ABC transport system permease protein